MKKTIRLTESELVLLVKRIINESAEGADGLIDNLKNKYNISDELKEEILRTIDQSGCKKIVLEPIKADGVCMYNRLVLNDKNFNRTLGRFLFILFHELAHQFQFKKYGMEKMMELYTDKISIDEAGQFMFDVEKVADEFASRKMSALKRKGLVDFNKSDVAPGYILYQPSHFNFMIKSFRDELKRTGKKTPEEITEYLYNMIKIQL
jgi:hypothetical protein